MAGKEEGSGPHPSRVHSAGPWGALPQSQSDLKEQTLGEGEGRPLSVRPARPAGLCPPGHPPWAQDASVPAPGSGPLRSQCGGGGGRGVWFWQGPSEPPDSNGRSLGRGGGV